MQTGAVLQLASSVRQLGSDGQDGPETDSENVDWLLRETGIDVSFNDELRNRNLPGTTSPRVHPLTPQCQAACFNVTLPDSPFKRATFSVVPTHA